MVSPTTVGPTHRPTYRLVLVPEPMMPATLAAVALDKIDALTGFSPI